MAKKVIKTSKGNPTVGAGQFSGTTAKRFGKSSSAMPPKVKGTPTLGASVFRTTPGK